MRVRPQIFLLVAMLAAVPAAADAAGSPPDFGGVWDHPGLPGFEPLASGPTSLVNLSRREGNVSNNMQLVGDYKNPILKPETAATVKKFGDMSLSHIGYPTPRNQCWPGGVPFEFTNNGLMMLQKPDEILILYRGGPQVRRGVEPLRRRNDGSGRFVARTKPAITASIVRRRLIYAIPLRSPGR